MIPPVRHRPRARLDLLEQFVCFGEQTSVELAERYVAAVEATLSRLAGQPHAGALYDSAIAGLRGLRRIRVKGFENYLIFYLPHEAGIDVIRVLHGARDIGQVFAHEEA